MRSIFHTSATSAEDLRKEIVADLERRIAMQEAYGEALARTIKERAVNEGKISTLRELARFWSEIIIESETSSL